MDGAVADWSLFVLGAVACSTSAFLAVFFYQYRYHRLGRSMLVAFIAKTASNLALLGCPTYSVLTGQVMLTEPSRVSQLLVFAVTLLNNAYHTHQIRSVRRHGLLKTRHRRPTPAECQQLHAAAAIAAQYRQPSLVAALVALTEGVDDAD
jgi:hypothetical protein